MGGCCTARGLALWDVGVGSIRSLLWIVGLVKARGEGEIADGEDVLEEKLAGDGDIETAAGRGEGVFGTEIEGVRSLQGGEGEKFKLRS